MLHLMKFYRSGGGGILMMKNGLSALLKSPLKGLLFVQPSQVEKLVSDHVGGVSAAGFSSAAASETMGDHVSFNQFPGIMVPDENNTETRRFLGFNPNTGSFERDLACNPLPIPHGYACKGSAYGWVFLVGDELDTKLMNPFTREEIQLPSVTTLPQPTPGWMGINKLYVLKAVFSSNPALQPAPVVLVIHRGDTPRLAYCKVGDTSWTSLHHPDIEHIYYDAIFHNNQFYAISQPGYIRAYDIGRRTDDKDYSVRNTLVAPGLLELTKPEGNLFLVVLDGELIKVTRKISKDENPYIAFRVGRSESGGPIFTPRFSRGLRFVTSGFLIRKFVTSENRWVKVESLGDHALFLGQNTSFSLRASQHSGCIPNAIYFTDCSIRQNQESGSDMGVYKLSDGSITPLYPIGSGSVMPPPVMVTRVDMFRAADIPILCSDRYLYSV